VSAHIGSQGREAAIHGCVLRCPRRPGGRAGTFQTQSVADHAWQDAESTVRKAGGTALVRGQQKLRRYVANKWFPTNRGTAVPRELPLYPERRILPVFSSTFADLVMPDDGRVVCHRLERQDVKPSSIGYRLTS